MGVEPYLVTSSVEMIVAQRLVRLICPKCREQDPGKEFAALRAQMGAEIPEVLYRGRGCHECRGTGFRGRTGVFELMPMTDEVRALIQEHADSGAIRKVAVKQGMNSLRGDGWRLVREGRTTVEEVLRNTKNEKFTSRLE